MSVYILAMMTAHSCRYSITLIALTGYLVTFSFEGLVHVLPIMNNLHPALDILPVTVILFIWTICIAALQIVDTYDDLLDCSFSA